jgi:molybdopterin-guanine dinucleotide biosynthesis protein A
MYSKSCIPYLTKLIQNNNLRIYDFYPEVRSRIVQDEEVARYDPEKLSFFNINTWQELNEANKINKLLVKREHCTL